MARRARALVPHTPINESDLSMGSVMESVSRAASHAARASRCSTFCGRNVDSLLRFVRRGGHR